MQYKNKYDVEIAIESYQKKKWVYLKIDNVMFRRGDGGDGPPPQVHPEELGEMNPLVIDVKMMLVLLVAENVWENCDPRIRWKTCQRGTKWYVYVHYNVCVYIYNYTYAYCTYEYIYNYTYAYCTYEYIYIITHMHTVHMNNNYKL
jgi:hypothetical protein